LVVVGTRGRRELERLLLGSVAEKLFRQAACPVLVVPGGARSAGDTPIHRILCPIDFSADSPVALALSTSIASHYNAQLIVLHVLQQSTTSGESRGAKSAEERLQRLLDSKRDRLLNPQIEVASGTSVAKSIARAVVEYGCDLVVVAVHPAGVATAHEPERNAYRIIRWSDSPVLTIPRGYAQAG
jgi:nucleotide-binding universal stress UspA family protein